MIMDGRMKTSQGDRVSVPSRGFCFLGKHDLKKARVTRVSVPSRGSCFLEKHHLKKARVTGSAFLAGALFPGKT